jgi:peptide chain release factor subunit 1
MTGAAGAYDRPMPIRESSIRDLAAFKGEDAPVTSLYLDVDGRRRIRARDCELALERLARPVREGEPQAGHASVCADLKRIEEHVKSGIDRSHVRGLAFFSCTAHDFWRVVELAVPVRDRLVVNHTPYVRELEAVVARHERFAVLLADRQRARLLLFWQGELLEKQEQFDSLPRHDDDGGQLGKDQVAGHAAAAAQRHLRRVAAAAFACFQEQGFEHLVLGGPEEVAAELERELHPYLRERIAARVALAVHCADDEIRHAAQEVEAGVERAREAAVVERLRHAVGTGTGGVAGLDAVLEALVARRVDTLLVSEGFEAPGWRCRACAWVGTLGRSCPLCGNTMEQVEDVVEEAVEEALAQACRVAFCRDNADLDVAGRVGALLRY